MTGSCGRWVTLKEYAEMRGVSEGEAKELTRSGGSMTKSLAGREYVWTDAQGAACATAAGSPAAQTPGDGDGPENKDLAGRDPRPGRPADAVEGEPLLTRFSGAQELAHQAERAISLVERSLSTFMMMHQEVVKEKERYSDLSRDGLAERDRKIEDRQKKIEELENKLREKDQELADLKMLVEILEGRVGKREAGPPPREVSERATVGDLMEDQLRYIMEDQMIKELLKD